MKTATKKKKELQKPQDDHLDWIFHALSDQTRRTIVVHLLSLPARSASSTEIASLFTTMSKAAVNKHMRTLEHAMFVSCENSDWQGRPFRYTLHPEVSKVALRWLQEIV